MFIFVLSFIKNLPSFDLSYQNQKKNDNIDKTNIEFLSI